MESIRKWIQDNRERIDIAMVLLLAISGEYTLSIIFLLVFVLDKE